MLAYVTPTLLAIIGMLLWPVVEAVPQMQRDIAVMAYEIKDAERLQSIVVEHEAKMSKLEATLAQQQRSFDEVVRRVDRSSTQ